MLREKIESYSEISDIAGLIFTWESLCNGVESLDSLVALRLYHHGKMNINVDAVMCLFTLLGLSTFDGVNIIKTPLFNKKNISSDEQFISSFTNLLLMFLLKNDIVDSTKISFDSVTDSFILSRNSIKYKFACYRNLLLTLNVIEKREDGSFSINESFSNVILNHTKSERKLTEKKLLEILEMQRINGELGEKFVLNFELSRLATHKTNYKIKRISVFDVSAGYDIISYNGISSLDFDRFIEVKTYSGKPHFHWSSNEISTAKLRSEHYFLYLVDINQIDEPDYKPWIIQNPITYFHENHQWSVTAESFYYELTL